MHQKGDIDWFGFSNIFRKKYLETHKPYSLNEVFEALNIMLKEDDYFVDNNLFLQHLTCYHKDKYLHFIKIYSNVINLDFYTFLALGNIEFKVDNKDYIMNTWDMKVLYFA
jgi:hypothetical protein